MINLIKSETYKLRYTKTYKGLFILIILLIVNTIIAASTAKSGNDFQLIYGILDDRAYGFHTNVFSDPNNIRGIEFFLSSLAWTPILVIGLAYIVSTLICDEYTNGTYKNILTYGHNRVNVYIAKFIAISIGILVLIFLLPFTSLLIGTIIKGWGTEFKIEQILYMVKLLSINTIIFISIGSMFMLIGSIIKNKALLITVSFISILAPMFLIDKHIDKLKYYPQFMLMDTCVQMPGKELMQQMIITCTLITIFSIIIGSYIFKKQDIR